MKIDLIIELKAAEAKNEMAERLFLREVNFYESYRERANLKGDLHNLKDSLESYPDYRRKVEEELAEPDRLPPAVFQNNVTIYPVKLDN